MRVTNVELSSDNSNVFSFGLNQLSTTDKYLAKTIIGLDADEIVPKFYGFGQSDTSKFYRFSIVKREIVMRIHLNPNYAINESVSDIRDELYRSIASSRTGVINLLFMAGGATVATIKGFITKFEVPYFSKEPELQITIRCDDPMFRAYNPVLLDPEDLPATNPVMLTDSLSTAPHGVTARVQFTTPTAEHTVTDDAENPSWTFSVIPDTPFLAGDIVCICSDFGDNHLFMIRDGVTTHLMDKIVPGSIWPIMFPGSNDFVFNQRANFNWVFVRYYPAYWGV